MVAERLNIASTGWIGKLIIKTLNKGKAKVKKIRNIIFTGIGSEARMTQLSLFLPACAPSRT